MSAIFTLTDVIPSSKTITTFKYPNYESGKVLFCSFKSNIPFKYYKVMGSDAVLWWFSWKSSTLILMRPWLRRLLTTGPRPSISQPLSAPPPSRSVLRQPTKLRRVSWPSTMQASRWPCQIPAPPSFCEYYHMYNLFFLLVILLNNVYMSLIRRLYSADKRLYQAYPTIKWKISAPTILGHITHTN